MKQLTPVTPNLAECHLKVLTGQMFDSQAEAVLKDAIPAIESLTPDYRITWDRPASEYPDAIYNVMWLPLRDAAKD